MSNKIQALFKSANPIECMQILNGGVYISPTMKCNAQCRHCVANNIRKMSADASEEDVLEWIEQIHECGIQGVHFVGGEPFVVRQSLNTYIKKLNELDMFAGVVTNGLWAKTIEEGIAVLEEMPGLDLLIISSDKYHLEYIDASIVKNAIEAGIATGKFVVINVTYVESSEVKEINQIYKEYRDKILIQSVKAMPFDGEDSQKIKRSQLFKTPSKVPTYCGIGNYFVDNNGSVSACCQSSRSKNTKCFYLGNIKEKRLLELQRSFISGDIYRFFKKYGPRGLVEIFLQSNFSNELIDKQYTSACEICRELMDDREKLDYFLSRIKERLD